MTTTLAGGVRDISPLAVVPDDHYHHHHHHNHNHHQQHKTALQQRYDDYDTVDVPQHLQQQPKSSSPSSASSSSFNGDRQNGHHRFRKKQQHRLNNNNSNKNKSNIGYGQNKNNYNNNNGDNDSYNNQARSSHAKNSGLVKSGGPRRGKIAGPNGSTPAPTTSNNTTTNGSSMTSDYDNVVPSSSAVAATVAATVSATVSAADAVARLSKVEEEEAGEHEEENGNDSEQQFKADEHDKGPSGRGISTSTSSSNNNDSTIAVDDNDDDDRSDKNDVQILDQEQYPRDFSTILPASTTSGTVTTAPNANGDEAEPVKINDSAHSEPMAGDASVSVVSVSGADSHGCVSTTKDVGVSLSVSDQQQSTTTTTTANDVDDGGDGVSRGGLYGNSTKDKRWKWESDGGGVSRRRGSSSSSGGRVCSDLDKNDNNSNNEDEEHAVLEQKPAASYSRGVSRGIVSAIPVSVGKNERLLNEEEEVRRSRRRRRSDVSDNNKRCNGIGGKNHFAVASGSGPRGDGYLCDSRKVTSEQNIGTDLENVSVNREGYDVQRSSDCDNGDSCYSSASGKFAGVVAAELCGGYYGVHSKDYDNLVSSGNIKSLDADCKSNRYVTSDVDYSITSTGHGQSQSKQNPLHYNSVTIKTIEMGAKQSKRPNAHKANAVSYDHGQSKIEMKDLSRNEDDNNVSPSSHSRNNNTNHRDKVPDKERKSIDPIHGEIIEDENRSLSLDSYQTIPEYPEEYSKGSASALSVSFDRDDRLSSPLNTTAQSISNREDLLVPNETRSETRSPNEMNSQPIYAVVNKNKNKNSPSDLVKRPVLDNSMNDMDGDYSVPSWGQSNEGSQPPPSYGSVVPKHHQHVVNPSRMHRETVSACVSVSSLASSERGGSERGKPATGYSQDDDEYDDAFVDPKNYRPQMKKSLTIDSIGGSEHWRGSSSQKFPRSQSSSRDYFSLGRRPKVKRSRTLVDAHGKAVSMDTLLKARRRCSSFREPINSTTPVDNLSVEDILKSCEEFDVESNGFRSRSESAHSVSRTNTPLPFFLVKENDVPEVTNCRGNLKLNNLNASISDSNDSANSSTDGVHKMNIVNGEEVELRPSRSQIGGPTTTCILLSKTRRVTVSNPATPTTPNAPFVGMGRDSNNDNNVQSMSSSSSSRDLKSTPEVILSSNTSTSSSSFSSSNIPSRSASQAGDNNAANFSHINSTSSTPSTHPPNQTSTTTTVVTSETSDAFQNQQHPTTSNSNSTSAILSSSSNPPQFRKNTTTNTNNTTNNSTISESSSSGVFMMSTTTVSDTSSVSLISSPEIKFDSDQGSSKSVTSPFPVFSPSPTGPHPPPSKLTSLSVDVSSPLSEGSTSQSSSPAPRSPNSLYKLEAVEAIKWLRAAGFPQYAQMFDDGLFPIELALVEKDHDFLDKDSIQSLFRRLETLNKYAGMKIDAHQRKKAASEEEEEDDICALSERWEYQKSVRRWSRKDLVLPTRPVSSGITELNTRGSHDSLLADQDSGSQTGDSPLLNTKMPHKDGTIGEEEYDVGSVVAHDQTDGKQIGMTGDQQNVGGFPISPRLRRAASERIKTAKYLWKKMEGGLKSKKSRRHPRNIKEISDPVVAMADQENMQAKLQRLNCVDISPTVEHVPPPSMNSTKNSLSPDERLSSPTSTQTPQSPQQLDTSTEEESSLPQRFRSRSAVESRSVRERPSFLHSKDNPDKKSSDTLNSQTTQRSATSSGTDSSIKEFYTAQSQLLKTLESAHPTSRSNSFRKNSNDTGLMEIFLLPQDHQPGKFPRLLQNGYIETESRVVPANSRFVRENPSVNASDRLGAGDSVSGYRVSVYDNFSTSSDGSKRTSDTKSLRSLDQIHEDDSNTKPAGSGNDALHISEISNSSSSKVDTNSSQQSSYQELRDKILMEASSPSLPLTEIQSEGQQECMSPTSPKGGVSHSISVDSYLKDNVGNNGSSGSSSSHRRNSSSSSNSNAVDTTTLATCDANASQERSLSQQYDEFDLILREMYANISDLTRRMNEKAEDSTSTKSPQNPPPQTSLSSTSSSSSSYSSSSSSTPSSSHKIPTRPTLILPSDKTQQGYHHHQHHPHHHHHHTTNTLTSSSFDEGVVAPVSPNSDPILSPSSPLSHRLGDDSVDTDGVTDPDNENSSSGGGDDSHTGESVSDPEVEAGLDLSHDDSLEQIPVMTRERRDSGVGHSLTRAPSDRRRKKLRWHSFQRCHRPDINSRSMQINSLTVGQLVWLQKLSLLKLTGIMEKCLPVNKSGWNWMMPRFMKRNKTPDFSDKNVFGVPLSVMAQRTGQPLPQCVLYAMRYLRRTSQHAVGIFRKSGVKSKIQSLIDHLEANPDTTDFEDMNAYNVADMIKTFFRDLPECLLTNKLSETFRSIYTHVPKSQLLEAIQAAVLLLPDENREVLQSLMLFLSDISMHEADHQMNATNLAVCFTPTVFMLGFKQTPLSHSPKRSRKAMATAPGVPDPREIMEQKTSQDCLLLMITECKKLFTVPPKLFRQVQVQSLANKEASPVFELSGEEGSISEEIRAFGQERVQKVLKEAHDKNRGWLPVMTMNNIEINHRKPLDDCPLKEWKLVVDVDAPPIEVLSRIMHERHAWDEDLLSWSVVERIDPHSDIFQYVLNSMAPHPPRHFCVLRYWRTDLSKGACALITMSVDHADVQEIQGVAAVDYGSLYLMEPCGSGRTRLTHVTRMDTRGRCPEWYSKVFGHIVGNFVERLRDSFKQETSGPETKV